MESILTSLTTLLGEHGMFAVYLVIGAVFGGQQLRQYRKHGDSYDSGR